MIIPALFYSGMDSSSAAQPNARILGSTQTNFRVSPIGSGSNVHPYCSTWYTWPLMIRPVAYFYQTAQTATNHCQLWNLLPAGAGKVVYDVHAIGNPALVAINRCHLVFLLWMLGNERLATRNVERFNVGVSKLLIPGLHFTWFLTGSLTCCLGTGDALHLLYHHMGASVFQG